MEGNETYFVFSEKFNGKELWLEDQLRCLWEFITNEGLENEADKYLKENTVSTLFTIEKEVE